MALNLFKKSTERKAVEHINIAIYGESGLGKTTVVTSHLKNAVILDIENGLASMDGSDETLDIVDIHNSGKEKFSATNEDGSEYIYSPAEVFALTLGALEQQVVDGTFAYKTLVVDSYSMYSQQLFEAVAGDGKVYHEAVSKNHERLMRLPCNTIMIFQDSTVKTEDGYMKKTPAVVGSSFKDAIPYKYDVVLHLKKDGDKRVLDEDGTDTTRAKNRFSKKMGETKFNDFENLQEALDFLDKL